MSNFLIFGMRVFCPWHQLTNATPRSFYRIRVVKNAQKTITDAFRLPSVVQKLLCLSSLLFYQCLCFLVNLLMNFSNCFLDALSIIGKMLYWCYFFRYVFCLYIPQGCNIAFSNKIFYQDSRWIWKLYSCGEKAFQFKLPTHFKPDDLIGFCPIKSCPQSHSQRHLYLFTRPRRLKGTSGTGGENDIPYWWRTL